MNKKYFIMFGIIGLVAINLIAAAVLQYYGQHTETIEVMQPITVNGEEGYTGFDNVPCEAGQTCEGTLLTIENHGNNNVPIMVYVEDVDDGIETVFFAETTLTKKVVDFSEDVWDAVEPAKELTMRYAATGDGFEVEVMNPITGYELIYYKDNSDRFNSPAAAIKIVDVTKNLPYEDDANAEDYDYCLTNEYVTCGGAKIWYVPTDTILSGNELDWSRASEFYFETELIQFNDNREFTMYPGQILSLTPSYIVDPLVNTSDNNIVIKILPQ